MSIHQKCIRLKQQIKDMNSTLRDLDVDYFPTQELSKILNKFQNQFEADKSSFTASKIYQAT